ncbi:MAG: class I SAM-dependent methyltransferase, partial [Salinibacter sp.]
MPQAEGACKLCGAGALRSVYAHPSGQRLLACRACGFRFLAGSGAAAWDYWATGGSTRNVDVYAHPDVVAADRARHDRDLDLIECQMPTGKLLDYGCGTGAFVERAEARGWTAGGVDVSASAVAHARAQGRPVWTLDEYRRLDDPRGQPPYDVITLWDVLEHLDDPHPVMRWLASQMREDGLLFLETPAWNHWVKRLSLAVTRASWGKLDVARFFVYPDHRLYFTERTLRRLMETHG